MKKFNIIALIAAVITIFFSCQKEENQEPESEKIFKPSSRLALASFTDVAGHWAEAEITFLKNNGSIAGFADGTFKPNNVMTRGEFATLIVNVLNPAEKPELVARNFNDIATHWAKINILRAARAGFLNGYSDGTFKPDAVITKTEILVSIANGLNLVGGNVNTLDAYFDDASTIPVWAKQFIANAAFNRFVPNYPNIRNLEPNRNATRADAIVLIYQALVKNNTATFINNNYLVQFGFTQNNPNIIIKGQSVSFAGKATEITNVKLFVDNSLLSNIAVTNNLYNFSYSFTSTGVNRKFKYELFKNVTLVKTYTFESSVFNSTTPQTPDLTLMYHEITSNPTFSSDVSIAAFQQQMQWLNNNGYTTISTDDLYMGNLPNKNVLLIFDDGYIGNFNIAKPYLESLNMKADFYVHTDFVGVPSSSSYDHMSWNQLRLIDQSPLFSVFSHSKTHPYLTQISSALLVTEMVASKKRLEKELGGTRVNIAYPFGDYNQAVITAAQNAGFLLAWAVADNGTFGKPAQYSNPRIGIGKDITTIQAFKTRIKV